MSLVLYIHGFLSSPLSIKAQQVDAWLKQHRPGWDYGCPELPAYPEQAMHILEQVVDKFQGHPIYLLGSSLGGYYATYLSQTYSLKAILVNPAVRPYRFMLEYLHQELENYHTDNTYRLNDDHIRQIQRYELETLTDPEKIWLLAQTGDETLDYRDAKTYYKGCKQTIEQGGDHGFQGFEKKLPDIIRFFEN